MGHLELTVRFFDNRYHGDTWPPSPARLFQALVSGAKTGRAPGSVPHEDGALQWLEQLDAPDIYARPAGPGVTYPLYVPNNSLGKDLRSTKTSKQVIPRLLPDHCAGEPDVVYRWRIGDEESAKVHVKALDDVASRLRALGWGLDFAAAIVTLAGGETSPQGLERYVPAKAGDLALLLPIPGFLNHLEACHAAFKNRISHDGINPFTRPTRFGQARYRKEESSVHRAVATFDLLTPEHNAAFAARWDQVQTVSAWLRHAAGESLKTEISPRLTGEHIDSFVYGHTTEEDLGQRLSFVPLPSVGHRNADGAVRRAMIVNPSGAQEHTLQLLRLKLRGAVLKSDDGKERAALAPGSEKGPVFNRYLRPARIWRSVTPVILHGYNSSHGRISLIKTNRLLLQAFESAGFPESSIERMTFQTAPFWPGAGASSAIRVPRHLARWPRLHVEVEFKLVTAGPVLAGLGRHYGLGVFAGWMVA